MKNTEFRVSCSAYPFKIQFTPGPEWMMHTRSKIAVNLQSGKPCKLYLIKKSAKPETERN